MDCPLYNNGDIICSLADRNENCWSCEALLKNNELGEFHKSRDKLWEFTDVNTTGKPIQFHSKRGWNKHLKNLNMTDDVYHYKKIPKPKNDLIPKEEVKNLIRREMKDRGIYDSKKLFKRG